MEVRHTNISHTTTGMILLFIYIPFVYETYDLMVISQPRAHLIERKSRRLFDQQKRLIHVLVTYVFDIGVYLQKKGIP